MVGVRSYILTFCSLQKCGGPGPAAPIDSFGGTLGPAPTTKNPRLAVGKSLRPAGCPDPTGKKAVACIRDVQPDKAANGDLSGARAGRPSISVWDGSGMASDLDFAL